MIIKDKPDEFKLRLLTNADYEETHSNMLNKTLQRIEDKKNAYNHDNKNLDNLNSDAQNSKTINSTDELWLVEHNDVYTLGQACKPEHILQRNETPIIKTDRGGQITWHGKGQLVVYWLFDLNALGWKVRDLVSHAEQAIEDVVNSYLKDSQYYAKARSDAPGVYIYAPYISDNDLKIEDNRSDVTDTQPNPQSTDIMLGKIASLGFKIKQDFCYHGIALNIDCDLQAFNAINPCGYAGMQMLRLTDFISPIHTHDTPSHNNKSNQLSLFDEVAQAMVNNICKRHKGTLTLRPTIN